MYREVAEEVEEMEEEDDMVRMHREQIQKSIDGGFRENPERNKGKFDMRVDAASGQMHDWIMYAERKKRKQ